ncbi:hypothetical protein BASA81_004818 [Batrachochytrium salamandrivorans]|nr:hypothetical protein BASA81_004818 [Batrachochytrium salamandrivorans]
MQVSKKASNFSSPGGGEFQILLAKNRANATPIPFQISPDWDLPKFKKKASQALGVKVRRVFLLGGEEVLAGVDEISSNSTVYVSKGEAFFSEDPGLGEVIKIAVLGTGGVGKSAVTLRFARDVFVPVWESTIEDAYRVKVSHRGEDFVFDILDTAGQDDFESLRPSWMADKHAYVFVFSLAQPESYRELKAFFDLHQELNVKNRIQICIVGNKQDLVKDLASAELAEVRRDAKQQALTFGGTYLETSASSGENVSQVFQQFLVSRAKLLEVHNEMQSQEKCAVM